MTTNRVGSAWPEFAVSKHAGSGLWFEYRRARVSLESCADPRRLPVGAWRNCVEGHAASRVCSHLLGVLHFGTRTRLPSVPWDVLDAAWTGRATPLACATASKYVIVEAKPAIVRSPEGRCPCLRGRTGPCVRCRCR